jgi:hypothetical protein
MTSTAVFFPPGDNCIIIINDADEEEEPCEEDAVDTDVVPSFAVKSPTPTTSVVDADDTTKEVLDDSNDDCTPDRAIDDSSSGGDEAGSP